MLNPLMFGCSDRNKLVLGKDPLIHLDRDPVFSLKLKHHRPVSRHNHFLHKQVPELIIPLLKHQWLFQQVFYEPLDSLLSGQAFLPLGLKFFQPCLRFQVSFIVPCCALSTGKTYFFFPWKTKGRFILRRPNWYR